MEPTPSSAALAIDHYPAIEKMLGEIKDHFGFKFDLRKAVNIFNEKFDILNLDLSKGSGIWPSIK